METTWGSRKWNTPQPEAPASLCICVEMGPARSPKLMTPASARSTSSNSAIEGALAPQCEAPGRTAQYSPPASFRSPLHPHLPDASRSWTPVISAKCRLLAALAARLPSACTLVGRLACLVRRAQRLVEALGCLQPTPFG